MSEDLVKQAELRHQRKPRTTVQNEEILLLDKNCTKLPQSLAQITTESKQSLPPIRHHGNHENNNPLYSLGSQSKVADDRPRTPRRRTVSQNNHDVLSCAGDQHLKGMRLPFIVCKVNDKEYKALVNTGCHNSTIHRRLMDAGNLSKAPLNATIHIGSGSFKANLLTDDISIHDLVLGMDFITANHCTLNFATNNLCLNSETTVPFLQEEELPLKYRTAGRANLTASM